MSDACSSVSSPRGGADKVSVRPTVLVLLFRPPISGDTPAVALVRPVKGGQHQWVPPQGPLVNSEVNLSALSILQRECGTQHPCVGRTLPTTYVGDPAKDDNGELIEKHYTVVICRADQATRVVSKCKSIHEAKWVPGTLPAILATMTSASEQKRRLVTRAWREVDVKDWQPLRSFAA